MGRRTAVSCAGLLVVALTIVGRFDRVSAQPSSAAPFTVDHILDIPAPDNLVASPVGATIAWTFNERGARNIYVAEGPAFAARRLTAYSEDDGQELTQLAFTPDGTVLVYVRGGDHGSNRPGDPPPDPAGNPVQPRIQIWAVPVAGGQPVLLGDGDEPAIAPDGRRVAFVSDRRIAVAPIDGSKRPEPFFYARGSNDSPTWSPDGGTLAFVSSRGDHRLIGLFTPGQPIRYIAPSTSRDSSPMWSPDGRRIVFVRQPGVGGVPRSPLVQVPQRWSVLVADLARTDRAETLVTSGTAPIDRILQNPDGLRLWWAANDRLVFTSYRDGWPHLYSVAIATRGSPLLLTPGQFMVEQASLTPDRRAMIYNANTGSTPGDVERRHLFKVPVDSASPLPLTSGIGIEWSPVATGDGRTVAFLKSDARQPPMPAVTSIDGQTRRTIGEDHVSKDFPVSALVVPETVTFRAADGVDAHGQLFTPPGGAARKPAIVYVHGGGPRQMLLGWHYRWEYANDYGANQYLANRGFVVLSVNYRLSVGYGQAFQFPEHAGARGASEYLDVVAAGRYLQKRPDIDPARIGVWGASYGGYLTALALGRNSEVFAAGVDIHGVHDRLQAVTPAQLARAIVSDGITEADLRQALKIEFESSPTSAVPTWKSPVLLIHGDDDRTVDFHQTVDLKQRLLDKGITAEELVLPDDVHDSLLWRNWRAEISAMAEFFERTLQTKPSTFSGR